MNNNLPVNIETMQTVNSTVNSTENSAILYDTVQYVTTYCTYVR